MGLVGQYFSELDPNSDGPPRAADPAVRARKVVSILITRSMLHVFPLGITGAFSIPHYLWTVEPYLLIQTHEVNGAFTLLFFFLSLQFNHFAPILFLLFPHVRRQLMFRDSEANVVSHFVISSSPLPPCLLLNLSLNRSFFGDIFYCISRSFIVQANSDSYEHDFLYCDDNERHFILRRFIYFNKRIL